VARTKFLAKVGSRYAKPDGMKVIDPDEEIAFLHSLPVDYIWGVGPVTERKLHEIGIATVGELAYADRRVIEQRLGRGSGAHLMALAWNRDPRIVTRHHRARSVGAQSSFGGGGRDPMVRREILADLADRVGSRLRKKSRAARTITVRVRFGDLSSVTRSATLRAPVATTPALLAVAVHLADDGVLEAGDRDVNLLGIQSSNLVVSPHLQLELPFEEPLGADDVAYAGSVAEMERHRLDEAMDALHERFGKDAVGRASRLLGRRGSVPDEFRELATRD
jgi:DNA polymerase-4